MKACDIAPLPAPVGSAASSLSMQAAHEKTSAGLVLVRFANLLARHPTIAPLIKPLELVETRFSPRRKGARPRDLALSPIE